MMLSTNTQKLGPKWLHCYSHAQRCLQCPKVSPPKVKAPGSHMCLRPLSSPPSRRACCVATTNHRCPPSFFYPGATSLASKVPLHHGSLSDPHVQASLLVEVRAGSPRLRVKVRAPNGSRTSPSVGPQNSSACAGRASCPFIHACAYPKPDGSACMAKDHNAASHQATPH